MNPYWQVPQGPSSCPNTYDHNIGICEERAMGPVRLDTVDSIYSALAVIGDEIVSRESLSFHFLDSICMGNRLFANSYEHEI